MKSPDRNNNGNSILMAEAQDIGYGGARKSLEDRCSATFITTARGLELYVGLVADGVGGENAGEVASQLASDVILQSIQKSTETDIFVILEKALTIAHQEVRENAPKDAQMRRMSTTATIAVIHNRKLYIAHLGDSRVYMIRGDRALLLTLDHSWGNEMIRLKRFTPEEMTTHSRRDELARYLGQPASVPLEIDLGIRFIDPFTNNSAGHPAFSELKREAIDLQPGDVIILCSDGLIKERRKGEGHYVETNEIITVTQRKKNAPQDTANTLLSLALGRQTDDNVSVVIMEVPGGVSKPAFLGWLPTKFSARALLMSGLIFIALFLLAIVVFGLSQWDASPTPTHIPPTSTILVATNTPSPLPPAVADRGMLTVEEVNCDAYYSLKEGGTTESLSPHSPIPAGEAVIWTSSNCDLALVAGQSHIYLGYNTSVTFLAVADGNEIKQTEIKLTNGELLVVGGNVIVVDETNQYKASGDEVIMGINHPDLATFLVSCLGGECQATLPGVGQEILSYSYYSGYSQGIFILTSLIEIEKYAAWNLLCGGCVILPTPTSTPTQTETPTPTLTSTPQPNIPPTKDDKGDDDGGGGGGGGGGPELSTPTPPPNPSEG